MIIWGNHSATQYPDIHHATVAGESALDLVDHDWLTGEFIPNVQQRGAAIIKARGASSAASAANAIIDTVGFLTQHTAAGDWHSVAVCSDGSYGTGEGLITSFPIRSDGDRWKIVPNVPINDFSRQRIDASVAELAEERSLVAHLLN